jgi:hypothetical protein
MDGKAIVYGGAQRIGVDPRATGACTAMQHGARQPCRRTPKLDTSNRDVPQRLR